MSDPTRCSINGVVVRMISEIIHHSHMQKWRFSASYGRQRHCVNLFSVCEIQLFICRSACCVLICSVIYCIYIIYNCIYIVSGNVDVYEHVEMQMTTTVYMYRAYTWADDACDSLYLFLVAYRIHRIS